MRISNILPIVAVALAAGACSNAQGWGGCKVKEPRKASVDVAGAKLVRVHGGAGWLKIHGADGATSVDVDGEACASSQKNLGAVKLVAERRGDEVLIEADIPNNWSDGGALDMDITVPANLKIVAKDGSGGFEARHVASIELEDGSGGVEIEDVTGDVRVRDGSGGLTIKDVKGSVSITDGSGGIEVSKVDGDVTVERDGSGGIRVTDVTGNFVVEHDGSGGVSSDRIGGDTRVAE